MIAIVLTVCLITAPGICHDESPPIAVISGIQCMMQGQQIAAEWLEDHPKWMLQGWRCGPPRQDT